MLREVAVALDSARVAYALPDRLLIPGSESVWLDSTRLRPGRDYDLAYATGTLVLRVRTVQHDTLRIRYRRFALKRAYFHRRPVVVAEKPETNGHSRPVKTTPVPRRRARGPQFGSRLRNSGSIRRGLSLGSNQNLRVDSGLRFQVSGYLTKDVEVVASLSDQNTPIQPEGNTQSLQEIDKVFVQIKAPNVQATLGDYFLHLPGTEFTNYSRRLQGAMARAEFGQTAVTVSGAVSKGRFATNEFLGQEGVQGPYQLVGPEGQRNIIVLAGTERVWVDGELMTRGEDNDYVIEYANGQITFSRHRLITADSRITVDFQFSDQSYQRSLWSARAESRLLNEKLQFRTTFIRESDDKDNPLGLTFNDKFKRALEEAGDSLAVLPGSSFVGPGKGVYVRDSTGVFVYVGPNAGEYEVRFSFVGENQGDYRNVGLGRYEYVGENQGDYDPLVILPRPQRHDVVGFNLDFSPGSRFSVRSELALSQFDQNLFSPKGDGDNQGVAYSVQLGLNPTPLKLGALSLGRVEVRGRLRRKNRRFRDIDRTTQVEFNRRWDISNPATPEESIEELSGRYVPLRGWSLRGALGRLTKGPEFRSRRWEFETVLEAPKLPRVRYFVESIGRDDRSLGENSDWLRQRAQAFWPWKGWRPLFEYEGEIKKEARGDSARTGFRFDSFTAGLQLKAGRHMTASVRVNRRDDRDRLDGAFVPKSEARTLALNWTLRKWHAFNVAASFAHRKRDYADPATRDTRTDLVDVRLGFSPRRQSVRSTLYYQVTNTQVAKQEEVFVEVGEGEGNYRFNPELGEFEPDPFGNFVRQVIATNNFVPVVELKVRADLRLQPARFFGSAASGALPKLLRPVSTETFVRIEERTRERNVARIYLLDLERFQQDSTTLFGSQEVRQDVYLWRRSRAFSVRYRFRTRSELNNQLINAGQKRRVREHRLRVVRRLSQLLTAQAEFVNTQEDRLFRTPGRQDRRIRANDLELDLAYRPRSQLELGAKGAWGHRQDVAPATPTRAQVWRLAPRFTYSLSQKGRFNGEVSWTRVRVRPNSRLIPFELTRGNRPGTTVRWNLGFDYRLSNNVQATFSYVGRKEPGLRRTQHLARVEMRAFF